MRDEKYPMRLPNALLIGAMKAGTTSLYMDLAEHPQVALVGDKEPHALCHDNVLQPEGLEEYAKLYANCTETIAIDASTGYSKLPDQQDVVGRAKQVLPVDFRVIYLVREPIARIVSQHYHEFSIGQAENSIDQAVRAHPRFLNYSRYAYQLEPWVESVGLERIHVVRFEDYASRRQETVERVWEFLGLQPPANQIDTDRVYNKSQGKPVRNKFWSLIYHNSFYRGILRPLIPLKSRLQIGKLFLPKTPDRPTRPQEKTIAWLREELQPDVEGLSTMLGLELPLWEEFNLASTSQNDQAPLAK